MSPVPHPEYHSPSIYNTPDATPPASITPQMPRLQHQPHPRCHAPSINHPPDVTPPASATPQDRGSSSRVGRQNPAKITCAAARLPRASGGREGGPGPGGRQPPPLVAADVEAATPHASCSWIFLGARPTLACAGACEVNVCPSVEISPTDSTQLASDWR